MQEVLTIRGTIGDFDDKFPKFLGSWVHEKVFFVHDDDSRLRLRILQEAHSRIILQTLRFESKLRLATK